MIRWDGHDKVVVWTMTWEEARDLADFFDMEGGSGEKSDAAVLRQAALQGAGF